jgi:hypothetical protein
MTTTPSALFPITRHPEVVPESQQFNILSRLLKMPAGSSKSAFNPGLDAARLRKLEAQRDSFA